MKLWDLKANCLVLTQETSMQGYLTYNNIQDKQYLPCGAKVIGQRLTHN